jgi:hypothetical protein
MTARCVAICSLQATCLPTRPSGDASKKSGGRSAARSGFSARTRASPGAPCSRCPYQPRAFVRHRIGRVRGEPRSPHGTFPSSRRERLDPPLPGTGPRIRDHLQAAIVEALLHRLDSRWKRFLGVPVYRPVRGVIDLVLHDPAGAQIVAVEVHSEIRRLEQLLQWANEKRNALPSAEVWRFAAASAQPALSSLLVLRSTPSTRTVVDQHAATFQAAYPAMAENIWASLTSTGLWPGAGMIWASVRDGPAITLDRPPRGVAFGR